MPDTAEATARTHAFARIIGPFLVIVPGIVALRFPGDGSILTDFFENSAIVWEAGAILLFGGLLIIGLHHPRLRRRRGGQDPSSHAPGETAIRNGSSGAVRSQGTDRTLIYHERTRSVLSRG
jgi:hypothetical protein